MKKLEGWAPGYIKYKVVEQLCHVGHEMVLNKKDVILMSEIDRIFTIESGTPDLLKLTILKVKEES